MKQNIYKFFFVKSENYDWITFFRISIGILILLHFISILPDFNVLFSTNGIIPSDVLDVYIPNYIITLPKIIHFFGNFGMTEQTVILVFKIIYILLALLLTIGFYPRIIAFLLLFLQIALIKGSSFYGYGVDFFTSMSLFYLILIPSHYEYSFHTFLNQSIKKINLTPYRRLFQLHLSIAYFFSGFDKVLGFNWWNGESIWKAIHLPFVNKDFNFDFTILADFPITLIVIGWATITVEMCYPLFIWMPKTKRTWLYFVISMHLGIAIVLNLYFFSSLMIIWNITNFYFTDRHENK